MKYHFKLSDREKKYLKRCSWEAHDDTAVVSTPETDISVKMVGPNKFVTKFMNRRTKSRKPSRRAKILAKKMMAWLGNVITDEDIKKAIVWYGVRSHG